MRGVCLSAEFGRFKRLNKFQGFKKFKRFGKFGVCLTAGVSRVEGV